MNMHQTNPAEQAAQPFPSLSFQVSKDRCSITARRVASIMLMPEQIVHFPEAPAYCPGLIHLRGQVVPLADARTLFGLPALKQEHAEFSAMIDARKQDHVNWVNELERCISEDARFTLATDPHQCALGKWYDAFTTESHTVLFHLRKIEEPHRLFHEAAIRYNECKQQRADCAQETDILEAVRAARYQYMPLVLQALEDAKNAFIASGQAIVVVLEGEQGSLGLIVDQVHSVETVIPISEDQSAGYFSKSRFVSGVAKSEKTGDLLLSLNDDALLNLCLGLQY